MSDKSTYKELLDLAALLERHSNELQAIHGPNFEDQGKIHRVFAELLIKIDNLNYEDLLSKLTADPQTVKLFPRLLNQDNYSRLQSIISLSNPTEDELPTEDEKPAYFSSRVLVKKWYYQEGDWSEIDINPKFFKNWYHAETIRLARFWVELQDYFTLSMGSTPLSPADINPPSLTSEAINPKPKRTAKERFCLKETVSPQKLSLLYTKLKEAGLVASGTTFEQILYWFGYGEKKQEKIIWTGKDLREFRFFIEEITRKKDGKILHGCLKTAVFAFMKKNKAFSWESLKQNASKPTERIESIIKAVFAPTLS